MFIYCTIFIFIVSQFTGIILLFSLVVYKVHHCMGKFLYLRKLVRSAKKKKEPQPQIGTEGNNNYI